jgi:hypothetical protein
MDTLTNEQLTKIREYYQLQLDVSSWYECDERGCSQGKHDWSNRYIVELPEGFKLADIDMKGNYLGDWRKFPQANAFAQHDTGASATCVLKEKVNFKRNILDILS